MDNRISCVIVDDEERNRNYLFKVISKYCPEVLVLGMAANVEEGINLINREKPQLIFLDIEMPDGNGFELLQKISSYRFEVIFVTGYNDHAIRAIKFNALDYLLKPLDTDELREAVKKAELKIKSTENQKTDFTQLLKQINSTTDVPESDKLAIPTVKGIDFVSIKDILYCEAHKNYTMFFFVSGDKLLSSKNIGEYEKKLPKEFTSDRSKFFRAHKSYLVNLLHLKSYDAQENYLILNDGKTIPVAQRRKTQFLKIMK